MKILFITANRLGDGVLSLGAMDYLVTRYPGAEITVACGPLLAGIFRPVPGVINILSLTKQRWHGHWLQLLRATMGTRWDIIVDLRNSAVSRLLPAREKYVWRHSTDDRHKVEQIAEVMKAAPPPAPRFWFDAETLAKAAQLVPPGSPVLAIGPTANWPGKMWPAKNFVRLIDTLTAPGGILPQARVMVLAAPGEEEAARKVLDEVPENRRIDMIAKAPPLLAAAAIARADFYVGNDSGLTHTAAATGIPALALFGYGWPKLYRPWGEKADFVTTPETPEELLQGRAVAEIKSSLMASLTVTAAVEAAVKLWDRTRQ